MKTLTLHQPWASLIAAGVKTIETRSWSTSYRGPLAIHAGKASVPLWDARSAWEAIGPGHAGPTHAKSRNHGGRCRDDLALPLGAVVATCRLADVVPIIDLSAHPAPHPPCSLAEFHHDGDRPHQLGGLWLTGVRDDGRGTPTRVEDQRPFGDFTPGRYAWLLTDIEPLAEPAPAKGRQGLWEWSGG